MLEILLTVLAGYFLSPGILEDFQFHSTKERWKSRKMYLYQSGIKKPFFIDYIVVQTDQWRKPSISKTSKSFLRSVSQTVE